MCRVPYRPSTLSMRFPGWACPAALAATVAIESEFPFVKVISAESMVGYSEQAKCSQIAKVFEDAYRVRIQGEGLVRGVGSSYYMPCSSTQLCPYVGGLQPIQAAL